jgi:CO dehydrogenase/acetyl-CoA synthase beta subunit
VECHEFPSYVDLPSLPLCTIKFYNLFVGQPPIQIILKDADISIGKIIVRKKEGK